MSALDRRTALCGLAATAAATLLVPTRASAGAKQLSDQAYRAMTVIDAKCFFRDAGKYIGLDVPMSPEFATAVKASGLTAISTTIGGVNTSRRVLKDLEETRLFATKLDQEIIRRSDLLLKVQTAADLAIAKRTGRVGILYNTQGTDELDGDPGRIATLAGFGIRIFQLTYNNAALTGDGCMESRNAGITAFGRDVIAAIEAQKCLLDLSHAGRRTTSEAIAASTRPLTITHAGCDAVNPNARNVDDMAIKALADKGGVFGIFFMSMLRPSGQQKRDDALAHLEHAINVAGEDHVGIGTDGELGPVVINEELRDYSRRVEAERIRAGVSRGQSGPRKEETYRYIPEYNAANRYQLLGDDLIARGHSVTRVEKILGGNFARVMRETLP